MDAYEGAFDPAFSPDGRTLAIDAVADGVPGIFLIPARAPKGKLLTEADAVRVTSAPADTAFDPRAQILPERPLDRVHPLQHRVRRPGHLRGLPDPDHKVRTNGTGLRLLVSPELNGSEPDWHPSGLAITFDSHDNTFAPNVGHIMIMLADGSFKRVIVRGDADSHYGNPSFSPTAPGSRSPTSRWGRTATPQSRSGRASGPPG